MQVKGKRWVKDGEKRKPESGESAEAEAQLPGVLEEIEVEDFAVDGICGVY